MSRQTLYENRTSKEYESGVGLDIGHEAPESTTKKKRKKRDKCKCGSTTHLMISSKQCPWNKKKLAAKRKADEIIYQPVNDEEGDKNARPQLV